jgi:hypothetical protein
MSSGDKLILATTRSKVSPVWYAHAPPAASSEARQRILQFNFKGFAGGVPSNTETTAVKPRVGIE